MRIGRVHRDVDDPARREGGTDRPEGETGPGIARPAAFLLGLLFGLGRRLLVRRFFRDRENEGRRGEQRQHEAREELHGCLHFVERRGQPARQCRASSAACNRGRAASMSASPTAPTLRRKQPSSSTAPKAWKGNAAKAALLSKLRRS